jgi:hypothetical protein
MYARSSGKLVQRVVSRTLLDGGAFLIGILGEEILLRARK